MTELQIAIVAGAAVVLTWVLIANFRDQRAAKKAIEQRASQVIEEPTIRSASDRDVNADVPVELSEAIARLTWQEPISSNRIETELRGVRRVGSKPLLFGWQCAESESFQSEPSADKTTALQVGVLLATRSGPLHAMEYTEWHELVMKLANVLGAQCQIPEMTDALGKARTLDQQCAAVDAQLSLVVRVNHVLSTDMIVAAAQVAGLEQRGESRFAMGPIQQQLFSVFPGDTGDTLILLLDVPRTRQPRRAFEEMVRVGQVLAVTLSGKLVDESGRTLEQKDYDLIADQVSGKEQQLCLMGVEPGSSIALRLFL